MSTLSENREGQGELPEGGEFKLCSEGWRSLGQIRHQQFFNAKGQIENIFMGAIQSLLQIIDIAVVV